MMRAIGNAAGMVAGGIAEFRGCVLGMLGSGTEFVAIEKLVKRSMRQGKQGES